MQSWNSSDCPLGIGIMESFNVIGDNNVILWIPFFVRIYRMEGINGWYILIISAEIFFTVLSFAILIGFSASVYKNRVVHINLIFLGAFLVVSYSISMLARLVLIIYESGIIQSQIVDSPIPELTAIRVLAFVGMGWFLFFVTLERSIATFFVADYEKKRRVYLAVAMLLAYGTASVWPSLSLLYRHLGGMEMGITVLIVNAATLVGMRIVLFINERMLKCINDFLRRSTDKYSLSLRLQLKENIWTLKALPPLWSFNGSPLQQLLSACQYAFLVLCVIFPFLILPPIYISKTGNYEVFELLVALSNFVIATGVPVIFIVNILIFEQVREVLLPERLKKILFPRMMEIRRLSVVVTTDEYFVHLNSQWNTDRLWRKR